MTVYAVHKTTAVPTTYAANDVFFVGRADQPDANGDVVRAETQKEGNAGVCPMSAGGSYLLLERFS